MSLIVRIIGAQNAFVLKQRFKTAACVWVCVICALSDSILILLGVLGFARVIEHYPDIVIFSKYIGAGFLFYYGLHHAISAFKSERFWHQVISSQSIFYKYFDDLAWLLPG